MNSDFFIGKRDNEVIDRAKTLGFDKVYFIREINFLEEIKKDDDYDCVLIKTANIELMRRMIDKTSNYFSIILVLGVNDNINRIALEHKKVKMLVSPEYFRNKDYMNYRNSGLNNVFCKIARDNNKIIAINFNDVFNKNNREKAILFGRIMQNAELCRKYNAEIRCYNFASSLNEMKSASEIKSFCSALGMSTLQIKNILNF